MVEYHVLRRERMKKMSRRAAAIWSLVLLLSTQWLFGSPATVEASSTVVSSYKVSPGVDYRQERVRINGSNQKTNVLDVNLENSFTKLAVNTPIPFSQTKTTSQQARERTVDGHRVVGAVNATFFDMSDPNRLPFSIISENDRVVNYGTVSSGRDHYRSEPIAFGVRSNGKATVDHYDIRSSVSYNGHSLPITNMNYIRSNNDLLLFTPMMTNGRTGTNEFGVEVIVRGASKDMKNLQFGDRVTGTVERVRGYGDSGNAQIPEDGFVLSGHGRQNIDLLTSMKPGDTVEVSVDIDDKWKGAQFMLGSGPQLVRNGQVHITMNESNWRASQRVARTAVAVDRTGTKVQMITVEKMTLREFAEYLVSLGVDRALNLDGGGSTTMVARQHGQTYATLANVPSAGSERRVSATLQAISTAPASAPARLRMDSIQAPVAVGSTVELKSHFAMDEYYNTVPYRESDLTFTVTNGVGEVNGKTFRATSAGEGRIQARINGQSVGSIEVKVVNSFDRLAITPSKLTIGTGEQHRFTADAIRTNGTNPIFDSSLVNWRVEGGIGTITPNGRFTAGNEKGTGAIVATYGNMETRVPVTVLSTNQFRDVPNDHWAYDSLLFLKDRGILRGYADGTVKPGQPLTRSQSASMLVREFDLQANEFQSPNFKDVPSGFHAYHDIRAISGVGFMTGRSDSTFDPNGYLTRGQMATILVRAYGLEAPLPEKPTFTDVEVDHWAYEAIETLAYHGIASGYQDGRFGPSDSVSRAHFSVFLDRSITKLVK